MAAVMAAGSEAWFRAEQLGEANWESDAVAEVIVIQSRSGACELRDPSRKQAVHGAKILVEAQRLGFAPSKGWPE